MTALLHLLSLKINYNKVMMNDYGCNSCSSCSSCGGCKSACNKTYFNLQADPMDSGYWLWEINCENGRVKLPRLPVSCPSLTTNYSNATMTLSMGDCDPQTITGEQLGSLINMNDLRDVDAKDPDACSLLVFNPGCSEGDCTPDVMQWKKYVIPDAGDCTMEPDSDGYYRVLKKTDCGCITECRLPVVPNGMVSINYVRDSVPDDPDFPWYYGQYNDTINLHLADNASQYFGKYALKVTVNYGIQVILSDQCKNVNFRSLLVPVVNDTTINVEKEASILQGFSGFSTSSPEIPWGSQSMRGSFSFIVPKGKEAYLHHEFRLRTQSSFPNYYTNATYDGKRVPDNIASQINQLPYNASRLNALQVIIEPTNGTSNMNPIVDAERQQLDPAVDEYPSL